MIMRHDLLTALYLCVTSLCFLSAPTQANPEKVSAPVVQDAPEATEAKASTKEANVSPKESKPEPRPKAANAQKQAEDREPKFFHVPVISTEAGRDLEIVGVAVAYWRVKRYFVVAYGSKGEKAEFNFQRARQDSEETKMVAIIPAPWVERTGLAYRIASEGKDGTLREHFASERAPHSVSMIGYSKVETQRRALNRFGGYRSRFTLRVTQTTYGRRYRDADALCDECPKTDPGSDHLWHGQLEYLFRPLGFLHDFRFGVGRMRGAWPTEGEQAIHPDVSPGVDYGYGELNFEFHRWLSGGGRLVLGANSRGFTVGLGGIARIGDIAGTFLSAELETIGGVGSRTDLRFTWRTIPRTTMALGIEFTDWPIPESGDAPEGANLYYDARYALGANEIGVRLGNAKRALSLGGGFQLGIRYSRGL